LGDDEDEDEAEYEGDDVSEEEGEDDDDDMGNPDQFVDDALVNLGSSGTKLHTIGRPLEFLDNSGDVVMGVEVPASAPLNSKGRYDEEYSDFITPSGTDSETGSEPCDDHQDGAIGVDEGNAEGEECMLFGDALLVCQFSSFLKLENALFALRILTIETWSIVRR
jgi:hypothetical protein